MIKGYARVSTDGQDLATQHELLKVAGAELVYSEKQSVVKTGRAALARCMRSLEPGDTVIVTKLSSLKSQLGDTAIFEPPLVDPLLGPCEWRGCLVVG